MGSLGEFLRSRRDRIGPTDVGLPAGVGRRQTPGLRRAELAALAGVSVDYYIRLEQGKDTNPGPAVLDALASALRLNEQERAHMDRLTRPTAKAEAAAVVRPGLSQLLETVRPAPAFVLDPIGTILAANAEGWQLMPGVNASGRNMIRYVFTHPAARDLYVTWQEVAEDCVADLRNAVGQDALVAELLATSADFAKLWRHYDVRVNGGGRRTFRHPDLGLVELTSEVLTAVDGQRLLVFQTC
jgi:transcriptional regulator with XRE-family HTH domain